MAITGIFASLLTALTLLLGSCGIALPVESIPPMQEIETQEESEGIVGIPNPMIPCSSLEEAAELAGFSFVFPDTLASHADEISELSYYVYNTDPKLLELVLIDMEGDELVIRMAPMTEEGPQDISGVYEDYYLHTELEVDESYTMRFFSDEMPVPGVKGYYHLATLSTQDYNYSVYTLADMDLEFAETLLLELAGL